MCGIAGLIRPQKQQVKVEEVEMLSRLLRHRGPDDLGFLGWHRGGTTAVVDRDAGRAARDAEVMLVHRRLTIIDETEGGWQPMGDSRGRYYISFNGEIYNYIELRAELEKLGRVFHSSSDTEVLLQSLIEWGVERALPKLTGMFAFALLDIVAGTLTLARDPFGIKPLSYVEIDGGLAFASELTALAVTWS